MFLYRHNFITYTTSEFESNPKYITFPNTARIEFHYKQEVFVPLEDVVGPSIHYVVDKSEEKEEKK